jgi:hypothetical protein
MVEFKLLVGPKESFDHDSFNSLNEVFLNYFVSVFRKTTEFQISLTNEWFRLNYSIFELSGSTPRLTSLANY